MTTNIYIAPSYGNYVTQDQLAAYATTNYVVNGLAGKVSTVGTVSFTAGTGSFVNVIGNTGTFTSLNASNFTGATGSFSNLVVTNNLEQSNRLYAQYNYGTTTTYPTGQSVISYPTAVVEDNISKLTITNTNSRFQNVSGKTMYLAVTAIANAGTLDTVNPQKITLRIAINGASQANRLSVNIVYYPVTTPAAAGPLSTSTLLKLANNDYFEVFIVYSSASAGEIFSGSLVMCQV